MYSWVRVGNWLALLAGPAWSQNCPIWTVEGDQASAIFGAHVATAGDVNGDGFDDVIVGALNFTTGGGFVDYSLALQGVVVDCP